MPTGGINASNVCDYLKNDRIIACGGTWMVPADAIARNDFDQIRKLTREAVHTMLGFRLAHVGINCADPAEAQNVAKDFEDLFGFAANENPGSIFSAGYIESLKSPYLGTMGHIAIAVNCVERAVAYLNRKGVTFNEYLHAEKYYQLFVETKDMEYIDNLAQWLYHDSHGRAAGYGDAVDDQGKVVEDVTLTPGERVGTVVSES